MGAPHDDDLLIAQLETSLNPNIQRYFRQRIQLLVEPTIDEAYEILPELDDLLTIGSKSSHATEHIREMEEIKTEDEVNAIGPRGKTGGPAFPRENRQVKTRSGLECFNWSGTGACRFGEKCQYEHIGGPTRKIQEKKNGKMLLIRARKM